MAARPCFLMPGPYAPGEEVAAGLNLIRNTCGGGDRA